MNSSNPKTSITDLLSALCWPIRLKLLSRQMLTCHPLEQLCANYSRDQALIVCQLISSGDLASEATQTLWSLMQHYEPSVRAGALRAWVTMTLRCPGAFVQEATTDYFLSGVRKLIDKDFSDGSHRQKLLSVVGKVVDRYAVKDDPLYKFWLDIQPPRQSSPSLRPPGLGSRLSVPTLRLNDHDSLHRYQPTSPSTPSSSSSDASSSVGYRRLFSENPPPTFSIGGRRRADKSPSPIVRRDPPLDGPSLVRLNRVQSLPNVSHTSVPMLPMRVSWTNSTTSGFRPSEQWQNRHPPVPATENSFAPRRHPLLPSSQPAPSRSSIPNIAQSLAALRGSRALLNMSIADFCAQICVEASDSSLGRVHTIIRARSSGFFPHEYLMLEIYTPHGGRLWARLDRRPSERGSFLLSTSTVANDTVRKCSSAIIYTVTDNLLSGRVLRVQTTFVVFQSTRRSNDLV